MDNAILQNWKTGKVTASGFVKLGLLIAKVIGNKSLFDYLYKNHTKEGLAWKEFKSTQDKVVEGILEKISLFNELQLLKERMAGATDDVRLQRTWWILFDVTTINRVAGIYHFFLREASQEELVSFAYACGDLMQTLVNGATLTSHGVLHSPMEFETRKRITAQRLAECFAKMQWCKVGEQHLVQQILRVL